MQRLAERFVESNTRPPYQERLHELKFSLMKRHIFRGTLIMIYKLSHGYPNLYAEKFL